MNEAYALAVHGGAGTIRTAGAVTQTSELNRHRFVRFVASGSGIVTLTFCLNRRRAGQGGRVPALFWSC